MILALMSMAACQPAAEIDFGSLLGNLSIASTDYVDRSAGSIWVVLNSHVKRNVSVVQQGNKFYVSRDELNQSTAEICYQRSLSYPECFTVFIDDPSGNISIGGSDYYIHIADDGAVLICNKADGYCSEPTSFNATRDETEKNFVSPEQLAEILKGYVRVNETSSGAHGSQPEVGDDGNIEADPVNNTVFTVNATTADNATCIASFKYVDGTDEYRVSPICTDGKVHAIVLGASLQGAKLVINIKSIDGDEGSGAIAGGTANDGDEDKLVKVGELKRYLLRDDFVGFLNLLKNSIVY